LTPNNNENGVMMEGLLTQRRIISKRRPTIIGNEKASNLDQIEMPNFTNIEDEKMKKAV
jgi:hypothetical protein